MIFPIGDQNIKNGAKPIFTYIFIGANILIFAYMVFLDDQQLSWIYNKYATIPTEILQGEDWITLMTNMFLHGGLLHLLGNMLFMWIFADNIEAIMGNIGFIVFYLAGGIFASLSHVLASTTSSIPSLGASGALAAIMGAYLIFFPKSKIKVLVIYLFRNIQISALYFLGAWFAFQLVSSLWEMNKDPDSGGTAWWAHIGGFAFGIIVAFVLKRFRIIDIDKHLAKA